MAQPSGTFETYDAIGNREDLADIIYNISPTETPFMAMISRGESDAKYHQWQTDSLATASATNAKAEGDDASFSGPAATAQVGNYTQISDKTLIVSGTQEVVKKAGRRSELAYQLAKRGKELKRDLEAQMTSNTASNAGTADGASARVSGSLRAWIATNDSMGAGGASGGHPGTVGAVVTIATNGTQRAFLESDLKSTIQLCWAAGGDPTVIMVGPFNKTVISSFTGNSTRFDRGEDKRLVAAVDIYVSDFGEHRVVPNRFQPERNAYVLTPRMWSVRYLRSFRQHEIAKTGDAEKRQLLVEYTLRSNNEAASGVVADLLTS